MTPAAEIAPSDTSPRPSPLQSAWLHWLVAVAACLAIYWWGLRAWFCQDDFAWLGLRDTVHNWRELLDAVFSPTGHGTLRPLSERLYFLVFRSLFDLNPLPYRAAAFLTQFANFALLASIMRRVTKLPAAGFWAPIFWMANAALSVPMTWSSAYMQILCAFFLLLAFHFFLRYVETGERRYDVWQWVAFLVGFGAMETNLVYPALAASYSFFCARKYLRKTLPLFVPSLLYVILHMKIAPKQIVGPYSIHFDRFIFKTLAVYFRWGLVPYELQRVFRVPRPVITIAVALLAAGLLGFTLWSARRRQWLPLLFLSWFVILLSPVLPLREHRSPYYLTLAQMGLAMLGAYALARAWQAGRLWKAAGASLAAVYLVLAGPAAHKAAKWRYRTAAQVERMVMGVARAHQQNPDKTILLAGVDDALFWMGVADRPFLVIGSPRVYLTPESKSRIKPQVGFADLGDYFLAEGPTVYGLQHNLMLVYQVEPNGLREITEEYGRVIAASLKVTEPSRVDVGDPAFAYLLGPTWHGISARLRWMPKRATLRMGAPTSATQKLHVFGACAPIQLEAGPLEMRIAIDAVPVKPVQIRDCAPFNLEFDPPPAAIGRSSVEVAIEVNRTISTPTDRRELGLIFGTFEFK